MKEKGKKLAIILGAGIGQAVGLPSTNDITNEIIRGVYTENHTTPGIDLFLRNEINSNFPNLECRNVYDLLKIVKSEIDAVYFEQENKTSSYEDIFYLLDKIMTDDPIAIHLKNKILPEILKIAGKKKLLPLIENTQNYIKFMVERNLNKDVANNKTYKFINAALMENKYDTFDIFTLNHDRTLEHYFEQQRIDYDDGFEIKFNDEENSIWKGDFNKNTKIKLFKIHGSLGWWEVLDIDENEWVVVKSKDKNIVGKNRNFNFYENSRPLILTGTFNKFESYVQGIYFDLYSKYYNRLVDATDLIIIGYSFGDRGVNQNIIRWVNKHEDANRLVVVNNNEKILNHNAVVNQIEINKRISKINQLKYEGIKLIKHKKKIEELAWIKMIGDENSGEV